MSGAIVFYALSPRTFKPSFVDLDFGGSRCHLVTTIGASVAAPCRRRDSNSNVLFLNFLQIIKSIKHCDVDIGFIIFLNRFYDIHLKQPAAKPI